MPRGLDLALLKTWPYPLCKPIRVGVVVTVRETSKKCERLSQFCLK